MDPQGTAWWSTVQFPTDLTLLQSKVNIIFANGSAASVGSGVYNHHAVFVDADKKPDAILACPGKPAVPSVPVSLVAAVGEEGGDYKYAESSGKFESGYYVKKNDRFLFMAELVNYTNDTRVVYTQVDMEYVDGKIGMDSFAEALNLAACDGSGTGIRPAPGQMRLEAKSKQMTAVMDGYFLNMRKCPPFVRQCILY